ncbi:galactokinase family protein [Ruminococcus sp.]|uniref:galactokinase n=1 Tax=Ruminococcus sp. TaxID=41978 RepID=UPI001AFD749E|nr:galactokinase family protein [Ruminococcus sp.]MBO5557553.1 galactokinase [Ruminococcus sp.]
MKTLSIEKLYSKEDIDRQSARYAQAAAEFEREFGIKPTAFFSAPGRTEVGGNHTDHNLGCVLAAGVSLDIIAAVAPTDDGFITIKSEGFPIDKVNLADTDVKEADKNTSAALIRGMAAGFTHGGHAVGGFRAYCTSEVLQGSGLSSSAAYEVLVGTILNGLYNGGDVTDVEVAKIAQYAENVHFGKPSGLMDQMASSVGGLITIDFKDKDDPVIRSIDFDFAQSGHKLCIVDTKGSHADLTPEYAAIPPEMKSVAEHFGKSVLREISKADVMDNIAVLRKECGDRAVLRALHYFDENQRIGRQAEALEKGDFSDFLHLITESGNSSLAYLQNIFAAVNVREQGLTVALYLAKQVLSGEGACRVHGGGFAGTIQAFVPDHKLEKFRTEMDRVFGEGACHVLTIRNCGGTKVLFEA